MPVGEISARLACGHSLYYGNWQGVEWLDVLLPRRKDGSFGASKCPTCRRKRRIVSARWLVAS